MISNLVDSVFVIGASKQGSSVRYLKQLKSRGGELIYTEDNVIVCLVTQEDGKLQFVFNDFGNEYEHLQEIDHQERLEKVFELRSQGYSNEKIGRMLGVSEGTIRNCFKKIGESE
jgi:ATP/maltotriose-dependent transcriptional regulator MalT